MMETVKKARRGSPCPALEYYPPKGKPAIAAGQWRSSRGLSWGGVMLLGLGLALTLGSCDRPDSSPNPDPSPNLTPDTSLNSPLSSPPGPNPGPPIGQPAAILNPEDGRPIQIYTVDSGCEALVPQTVTVAKDQVLDGAVAAVIAAQVQGDFAIAGYRVSQPDGNQRITVEFRLPPDSPRSFASLSSCEQLALFGSLRQTLVGSAPWQVREVEFLQGGNPIDY